MNSILRLKPSSALGGEQKLVECLNEREVRLIGDDETYKFDQILNEEITQQELLEQVIQPHLNSHFFCKEDSLVLTVGPKHSGSSYTMIGSSDVGSIDGVIGRSLHTIFDKVNQIELASFKSLSKYLGKTLIGSKESQTNQGLIRGTIGLTMSIFEVSESAVRDLLTATVTRQNSSSLVVRDTKDGKIRPTGLTQSYISSFDHGVELVKISLQNRKLSKRQNRAHFIVQINLHELKKFGRLQTTRVTFAEIAEISADALVSDLSNLLMSLKADKFQSSSLKASLLNKILFSDMLKMNKMNTVAILTLDPRCDKLLAKLALTFFQPGKSHPNNNRTNNHNNHNNSNLRVRNETPIQVDKGTNNLSQKLEQLKLEVIETNNRNKLLEAENKEFQENLLTIEQNTRLEVSNHYEQMIDEMNRNSMTAKLNDDETNQVSTDAKLENLAQHYELTFEEMKKENAKLKLKFENSEFQKLTMDKLFHVELIKHADKIKAEYEGKLNDYMLKFEIEKKKQQLLSDTNEILDQKVQLLQSQVNILKEKAGRDTEEAEKLYSKIKLLRLDDEILMMINKKMKAQTTKEKPQKNLKNNSSKRKSGSALIALNNDPKKFTIYEDNVKSSPKIGKRKLTHKDDILSGEFSDIDMV